MDAENRSKSFVLGEYFADVPLRQEGHRRAGWPPGTGTARRGTRGAW